MERGEKNTHVTSQITPQSFVGIRIIVHPLVMTNSLKCNAMGHSQRPANTQPHRWKKIAFSGIPTRLHHRLPGFMNYQCHHLRGLCVFPSLRMIVGWLLAMTHSITFLNHFFSTSSIILNSLLNNKSIRNLQSMLGLEKPFFTHLHM